MHWARACLAVRRHGLLQFLETFHRIKGRQNDVLKWGDEVCASGKGQCYAAAKTLAARCVMQIEYHLVHLDAEKRTTAVALCGPEVLLALEEEDKHKKLSVASRGCHDSHTCGPPYHPFRQPLTLLLQPDCVHMAPRVRQLDGRGYAWQPLRWRDERPSPSRGQHGHEVGSCSSSPLAPTSYMKCELLVHIMQAIPYLRQLPSWRGPVQPRKLPAPWRRNLHSPAAAARRPVLSVCVHP